MLSPENATALIPAALGEEARLCSKCSGPGGEKQLSFRTVIAVLPDCRETIHFLSSTAPGLQFYHAAEADSGTQLKRRMGLFEK